MTAVTSTATPAALADAHAASAEELVDTAARLRFAATRLARLLRQQSDSGLTPTQLAALATVARCGPLPIGTLAEEEQVAAPTATKIVDKLHAAGYLDRHPDPSDRRVTRVAVTDSGAALLADLRARRTAWLATRLADLPAEEVARLTDALEVLEHLTSPPRHAGAVTPAERSPTAPPSQKPQP